jgi:hypothetical protein
VPGAAAGSRSAVLAGHSPPGPGPDDGSAAPQRCPEPDTSIRPGDRELAIFAGAPERSGSDLCRGQDASGCGRDILCSLPGAAVLMTASLATVPRRGARSGPLTRPDAGLDRRSLNAGSRVGHALNRQLPRPPGGPPGSRPTVSGPDRCAPTDLLAPLHLAPREAVRNGPAAPRARRSGSSRRPASLRSAWTGRLRWLRHFSPASPARPLVPHPCGEAPGGMARDSRGPQNPVAGGCPVRGRPVLRRPVR